MWFSGLQYDAVSAACFAIQILKSLLSSVEQIHRRTERDFPTVQINTSHIYSKIVRVPIVV